MNKGSNREMALIGVDVSKKKLDCCWLRDRETWKRKSKVFTNSLQGYQQFIDWLLKNTGESSDSIQVMMEATGVYHESLAYALHAAGFQVFVANPQKVHDFSKSFGKRSKTDKKDSLMLACFLASDSHNHRLWEPEPEEVRYLKAMLARLQALDKDIQREQNRREKADIQQVSSQVKESIDKMVKALEDERNRLEQQIDDHIDNEPGLKEDRERLESIPGIGRVMSRELLATLKSRQFKKASEFAAFLGLIPVMKESGTSVHARPRLSKCGASTLRAKLYLAAVAAKRHNPSINTQYNRLLARGKAKMSAIGAAMRKLAQIAFGVVKHQTVYDPQWA